MSYLALSIRALKVVALWQATWNVEREKERNRANLMPTQDFIFSKNLYNYKVGRGKEDDPLDLVGLKVVDLGLHQQQNNMNHIDIPIYHKEPSVPRFMQPTERIAYLCWLSSLHGKLCQPEELSDKNYSFTRWWLVDYDETFQESGLNLSELGKIWTHLQKKKQYWYWQNPLTDVAKPVNLKKPTFYKSDELVSISEDATMKIIRSPSFILACKEESSTYVYEDIIICKSAKCYNISLDMTWIL